MAPVTPGPTFLALLRPQKRGASPVNEPAPEPEPEGIPFSGDDKAAFYARARGSATESAAVLDL
jgi:hypothetical protein